MDTQETRVRFLELLNELSEAAEEKGYNLALWHASQNSGASQVLQNALSKTYEHSLEEWEEAIKGIEAYIRSERCALTISQN